jgi:hypothetical protein
MSILDDFDTLDEEIRVNFEVLVKKDDLFVKSCLRVGGVNAVVAKEPLLPKILNEAWNANLDTSFARQLNDTIQAIKHSDHQAQKSRPIYSIDCSKVCKGDAYGWLSKIAEVEDGAIIVVENVTRVPSGNPNIYDDPTYVTNLLLRSWKNEVIYAGDVVIDRRKLTVILTCPPEDAEILERECGLCSYAWFRDFNKYMDELHQMAEETVTLEA